ncbi:tetratricopeptide repeat protein [Desulfobacterales bacterium HSG16]|nr:tetratricopeptide repeat protein [Desulfobacterales bacterium HSG16]
MGFSRKNKKNSAKNENADKSGNSGAGLKMLIRIIRLPIDIILISLDYLRVLLWLPYKVIRKIVYYESKCLFATSNISRERPFCKHARLYGTLKIFQCVCTGPQASDSAEGEILCTNRSTRFKVFIPGFFALGLVLALLWGGTAIMMLKHTPLKQFLEPKKGAMTFTSEKEKKEQSEKFLANARAFFSENEYRKAWIECLNAVQLDPENPVIHVELGKTLLKLGDIVQARLSLVKAFKINPNIAEIHINLGKIAGIRNDLDKLFEHANKARKLNSEDPEIFFLLAFYYKEKGGIQKAIKMVDIAIKGHTETDTLLNAAAIYTKLKAWEKAAGTYKKVLKTAPDQIKARIALAAIYREMGMFAEAGREISEVIAEDPLNADALSEQAELFISRGITMKGIAEYEKIVTSNSSDNKLSIRLAFLYAITKQHDKSLETIDKILQKNPSNPKANLIAARIYSAKGLHSHTIRHCRQGLVKNRKDPRFYHLLVNALLGKKQYDLAKRELEIGLKHSPGNMEMLIQQCWNKNMQGKSRQALECLKSLSKKYRNNIGPYMYMASIRISMKDYKAAVRNYEKILEIDPEQPVAMNNLAHLLMKQQSKDIKRAVVLAEKAKKLQPGDPNAADTLGWIYYHQGKYSKAVSELWYAAQILQADPSVRYHYAAALYKSGQFEKAKAELETAFSLEMDFDGADHAKKLLSQLKKK